MDVPLAGALIGRQGEQRLLGELVDGVRHGRSGVVVVRGEPGIGKTALLGDVATRHRDFRVIRINGAETEMELAYSGVQQLCDPLMEFSSRIPSPQRTALEVALGLRSGPVPDRLLVGLAVLTLVSEAGNDHAMMCLIDDAQWVDDASLKVLAIVARRLVADRVAMIFAARDREGAQVLPGFPELRLDGLSATEARNLLNDVFPGQIDERVRETVITEAGGSPLALLELHRALTPEELAGGYGLTTASSRLARIEQTYGRQIRELPSATRLLLLIAAAEPAGRPAWLWAAADLLGVGIATAAPAEGVKLVTANGGISFRHPLIRSVVYQHASLPDRRRVHAALASAIGDDDAREHRAWHRAQAAAAPDEDVAAELEYCAARAGARGGSAAAATFLATAASLTPEARHRTQRALSAAAAKLDAGAQEAAGQLLAMALQAPPDEFADARIELLRTQLALSTTPITDAPQLLLASAQRLAHFDATSARETYLQAVMAAVHAGRLATEQGNSAAAVAEIARTAPTAESITSVDLLLDGLIVRLTEGFTAAAPLLRRAIDLYLREEAAGTADPRWHDTTHRVSLDLFDRETYSYLAGRQLESLRAAGALSVLPTALLTNASLLVTKARFDEAAVLLEEANGIVTATTGAPLPITGVHCHLEAYRGQEDRCQRIIKATIANGTARGAGSEIAGALHAQAVLLNGLGKYHEALSAAVSAAAYDDIAMCGVALIELVEAASKCGEMSTATEATNRLLERTESSPTAYAAAVAARCAALVGHGDAAELLYRTAIARITECNDALVQLPRTHLLYGEWLQGEGRQNEAQEELRHAVEMFTVMGAEGFADRARRGLRATGAAVGNGSRRRSMDLTTQEFHIATLASDGHTSREIGSTLFLSRRTVEWHLGKIFAKLNVTSRRQLRVVLFEAP
ncbi:MAG: AAA family ATPase [Mycobacterium sp.]